MLHLPRQVDTPRLVLRPIDSAGDVDAVHAYAARADVCRYIPWEPKTREEVAAWLPRRDATTIPHEGQAASLAITLRETGQLIGDVMFIWVSEENRTGEIGYVINPDHHGQGYASETAAAMLQVGFDHFRLHRMIAYADTRNLASIAVLDKLGMRRESLQVDKSWLKGAWASQIDFALLDHEWRQRVDHGAALLTAP